LDLPVHGTLERFLALFGRVLDPVGLEGLEEAHFGCGVDVHVGLGFVILPEAGHQQHAQVTM